MPNLNEIRAHYNADTIVIYQAYSPEIALPALAAQRFVPPFSLARMTWIKPSFLWLMERSNWAQKSGQEHILAVRIRRSGWDEALSSGVLTSYSAKVHCSSKLWREQFEQTRVCVQWDPERSICGADLGCNSIQVGLSRHIVQKYVEEWIVEIKDLTPLARKIHGLLKAGQVENARKLLPPQRIYPVDDGTMQRLGMKP